MNTINSISPVLSIIIPAYNTEKYIKQCIDSVMEQDLDKSLYEVIVVNDGSTDNTKIIVEDLRKKYKNLRVYNKENEGVSKARNYGVTVSNGKYIWFIDSDDLIKKNILKQIAKKLSTNLYEVVEIREEQFVDAKTLTNDDEILRFDDSLQIDGHLSVSYIILREFFEANNLWFNENMHMHEDALWCLYILILSKKNTVMLNTVYFYRQHSESTMKNKTKSFFFKHSESLICEAKILKSIYLKASCIL